MHAPCFSQDQTEIYFEKRFAEKNVTDGRNLTEIRHKRKACLYFLAANQLQHKRTRVHMAARFVAS